MDELKDNPEIHKALLRVAHAIRSRAIDNLANHHTNFSNQLSLSITVVEKDGHVFVGSDLPYAPCVEFGALPHMPPVKPLKYWVRLKLGVPRGEANSVAWAVAMKIKKEGTPPQPFLRPAIDSVESTGIDTIFLQTK